MNQTCHIKKYTIFSSTFTFVSQILRTQFEHRIQYLHRHVSLVSLTYLRGESPMKDLKLPLKRITQPATYSSNQWFESTLRIQNKQVWFLMSLRLHARKCTQIFLIETLNCTRTGENWYLSKPKWWSAKLALPTLEIGLGLLIFDMK